jgi:MFS family permease
LETLGTLIMSAVTFRGLLKKNGLFRRLWAGQVVSELGNWFNFIAELSLVRALSGSPWAASAIAIAHLLPFCVLGPFAGAIADRISRRTLMLGADIARAFVALGLLFVTEPEHLPIAYGCAAGLSALGAFFEGAKNGAMPNLARGADLLPANALMHATRFLQVMIGAALGGFATDAFGYRVAFAINAVSFLVSAAFIAGIPKEALEEDRSPEARRVTAGGILRDVKDAFAFVRATPLVFGIVSLDVGWALGGGMTTLIIDRFGGFVFAEPGRSGDRGVAILYTAAGLGLWLGMVVSRRIGPWFGSRSRIGGYMGWSLIISGLLFSVSGVMPTIWLMAFFSVVNRLVLSAEYAVQETVLMNVLPDDMRGKVFTIDRAGELAMMSISSLVGSFLFDVLPWRSVPVIAGLLMALPGLCWLVALRRGRVDVPRAALELQSAAGD